MMLKIYSGEFFKNFSNALIDSSSLFALAILHKNTISFSLFQKSIFFIGSIFTAFSTISTFLKPNF